MNTILLNPTRCNMYNTTPVQSYLATTLESPSNPYHTPGNDDNDPLVAHGWQNEVYVGALVSVICLIIIIRVFSTQLDNAIIFALVLTAVAIAAVMLLVH